jgi:DeoR family transcriptional regulator, fructose operon transcriptional repressor
MAAVTPNSQYERLHTIERLMQTDGSVRIDELATSLHVSEMTIRRDLDELERLGVARRVRGGAVAIGPERFAERHRHHAKAKAVIAAKLRELLPDRGTVAFDASTTVHRLATELDGARDLFVLTNGIDTFQVLGDTPGIDATLTGGRLEPRTGSLVGPIATRAAQEFLFEVFVCSATSLDPDLGSSESSLAEAEVKRAIATTSSRIVLAADHSKLGTRAQTRMFRPQEIDVLVTDLDPDDDRLMPYRDRLPEVR